MALPYKQTENSADGGSGTGKSLKEWELGSDGTSSSPMGISYLNFRNFSK